MLDFAKPEDRDDLKVLWLTCFGGPQSYIDFYYDRRFVPEDTLVWRENDRPVSMMTLMRIRKNGEEGAYVYAVATLPEFRGRGLMTRLDQWSQGIMKERGMTFSALVPAEPGLFPMYEKLGYRSCFPIWIRDVEKPGSEKTFTVCSFPEFLELRRRFLYRILGAVWHPERELRYVYEELTACGGAVLRYLEGEAVCYAACTPEENGLLIREITGKDPIPTAQSLLAHYQMQRARIRSSRSLPGFQKVPYGMERRLDGKPETGGYMALMLD